MPIDALDLLRRYRQTEQDYARASAAPDAVQALAAFNRLNYIRQQVDALVSAPPEPPEPQPSTTPAGIESDIEDACDYADHVRISYRDAHGDYSTRLIAPSQINQGARVPGIKVVAAYDVDKQEPRHFRLDRITSAIPVPA